MLVNFVLELQKEHQELQEEVKEIEKVANSNEGAGVYREDRAGWMDGKDVIKRLRISERTLFNYRKDKRIKGKMIGGKYLYRKEEVEKLLN